MITKLIRRYVHELFETCFYFGTDRAFSAEEMVRVRELVAGTGRSDMVIEVPISSDDEVVEIGPRMAFETPKSSNMVSVCQSMGIGIVNRVEPSSRFLCRTEAERQRIMKEEFDRMTQDVYPHGITGFESGVMPEPVQIIPVLEEGIVALERANKQLGLGMDRTDLEYYRHLFVDVFRRNPTDVEIFQIGNANSEHCRHPFWKGIQIIDGRAMPMSLMDLVLRPLRVIRACRPKSDVSLAAFNDNSGVIKGYRTVVLIPDPSNRLLMKPQDVCIDFTATAETHNHPTGVAPEPGAETGGGGRKRDGDATGRGAMLGMGGAGYFTGNLFLRGYAIPGEGEETRRKVPYATPLEILIRGSNGVSRYGNQIGEPLAFGFCRTFGQMVDGELRQPFKPILYSVGTGCIYDEQVVKAEPEIGMKIVAIGGPAFRIGVGGGAASSMLHGSNTASLDFASVQRGNAEMENKTNRVIAACFEMGDKNPIASIHDQGAGGPSNVLSELMGKVGGRLDIRKINVGDPTMSVREIWSAEFQERYGLLIYPDRLEVFVEICQRERCPCEILGEITGDGKIVVVDSSNNTTPVDLDLEQILGNLPKKEWKSSRRNRRLPAFTPPDDMAIAQALEMVFRLPAIGSKDFLVTKVDNHVGGKVIQQQRCGPAQIPISDYALLAAGFWDKGGVVSALGENPILTLIDPKAGARMAVAEALANMAGVKIRDISAIRARANWMWAAKLLFEGPLLYDAVKAMSDFLVAIGFAIDGGKDSLSMATIIGDETIKAPGALVFDAYAAVPDFNVRVTADVKHPSRSMFGLIDLGLGQNRLSGSALAQALGQLGNQCPDIRADLFKRAFRAIQQMVAEEAILSLHDRSGGGLVTTVAEMCMASNCGFNIDLSATGNPLAQLFSEEIGWVMEFDTEDRRAERICREHRIPFETIGMPTEQPRCMVTASSGKIAMSLPLSTVRGNWDRTSLELEKHQAHPDCVRSAKVVIIAPSDTPAYRLTFEPTKTPEAILHSVGKPKVAVVREEGTNGDVEMRAALYTAGFEVLDFAMTDLLSGKATLDSVRMVAFPGGFSYMDVFGSGVGWAGVIRGNEMLSAMFDRFCDRPDTLSLGVCNGCQLMSLLGWLPWKGIPRDSQPRFRQNLSGRFESRWVQVEILPSPSVLLTDMEGSRLGVWVAHGEGRCDIPDESLRAKIKEMNLAPIVYIDPRGKVTEKYPYNPNGSEDGITALCSPDGRHLAMMPHPERCFLSSRCSWSPPSWNNSEDVGPWMKMFQNARAWLSKQK